MTAPHSPVVHCVRPRRPEQGGCGHHRLDIARRGADPLVRDRNLRAFGHRQPVSMSSVAKMIDTDADRVDVTLV